MLSLEIPGRIVRNSGLWGRELRRGVCAWSSLWLQACRVTSLGGRGPGPASEVFDQSRRQLTIGRIIYLFQDFWCFPEIPTTTAFFSSRYVTKSRGIEKHRECPKTRENTGHSSKNGIRPHIRSHQPHISRGNRSTCPEEIGPYFPSTSFPRFLRKQVHISEGNLLHISPGSQVHIFWGNQFYSFQWSILHKAGMHLELPTVLGIP